MVWLGCTSCKQVEIKDWKWCADVGEQGASCTTTISKTHSRIDKPTWDKVRFGQICTESTTIAEINEALKDLCFETGSCSEELKQKVEEIRDTLRDLDTLR